MIIYKIMFGWGRCVLGGLFVGLAVFLLSIYILWPHSVEIYAQEMVRPKVNFSQDLQTKRPDYVPGEVIVKFRKEKLDVKTAFGKEKASVFEKKFSMERKNEMETPNIRVYKSKKSTEEMIKEIKSDPNVEYAEPNYMRYPNTITTNDTYKDLLWGLDNTGQTVNGTAGTNDADIDAPQAWAVSEGSSSVIVAVIDTGVAYNHPDLLANMWNGTSCKDQNGGALGGCNYGYDFESDDKTPLPDSSLHGTHVAGTIAAVKNNAKGIIGVAPSTKIMALKYDSTIATEIEAIDFAIQNGAKVINASYGGSYYSQLEYDAINRFRTAGGIFVASAGNDARSNETTHNYPSDYSLDNIISVAATDQNNGLASFSNFGATSVDVGAPGTNIYSVIPNETTAMSETFEAMITPSVPSGWVRGGIGNNWGTFGVGGTWGKVLYSDLAYPYAGDRDTTITSSQYDLSGGGASMGFWAACDTEYNAILWTDYMQLEYSGDGVNFYPAVDPIAGGDFMWDEVYLDYLSGDSSEVGSASYGFQDIPIPSQYATSNFKFRIRWITNSSDNSYDGCVVDNIYIDKYSDGSDEKYGYMNGTSMAAPHVAGLAALIWGAEPNITMSQVKETIMDSGDAVSSLSGKTVSGKRINAYRAVNRVVNSSSSVFRFWNRIDGKHFYTISEVERDDIMTNLADTWRYEGIAYNSLPYQLFDSVPLYRFWNRIYGQHFYTISLVERNQIINTLADTWLYEGIAYYVYSLDSTSATTQVYRFWNKINGRHFFTISPVERDQIINTLADTWVYEGLAWKVSD